MAFLLTRRDRSTKVRTVQQSLGLARWVLACCVRDPSTRFTHFHSLGCVRGLFTSSVFAACTIFYLVVALQGSTIADVEVAGHLCTVLSCLESLEDLIRCSAVCKSWKEASEKVQPASLDMAVKQWAPLAGRGNQKEQLESILQCLQLHTRKGQLCKLRCLQVSCGAGSGNELSFMRCFLSLAGSWELRSCHIHGLLNLALASQLLPSCLQHIALTANYVEPNSHVLDKMQRFPHLCTLQLASKSCSHAKSTYLTVSLPKLSTLQLHGNLMLKFRPFANSLMQLLPKICHLTCCVNSSDLQEMLSLPHLVYAKLYVYFEDEDSVDVIVEATSNLRQLVLKASLLEGAVDAALQLSSFQPLLSYFVHSRGVKVKHNFCEQESSIYDPPVLFNMHSDLIEGAVV